MPPIFLFQENFSKWKKKMLKHEHVNIDFNAIFKRAIQEFEFTTTKLCLILVVNKYFRIFKSFVIWPFEVFSICSYNFIVEISELFIEKKEVLSLFSYLNQESLLYINLSWQLTIQIPFISCDINIKVEIAIAHE